MPILPRLEILSTFTEAMKEHQDTLARAATATMRDVAALGKKAGRAAVAAGGFSKKWENAIQSKVFPPNRNSLHPAATVYSKIPYAGIFQTGGTITPKRSALLWIPLSNVPVFAGGRRMTPAMFVQTIGPLYSINRPGHRPLLAAVIRSTDARFSKGVSLSQLRRGRNPHGRGTVRLVPIFVGISSVSETQKFDVLGAVRAVASQIPALYQKNLQG